MLILDKEQTAQRLPNGLLIERLHEMFVKGCEVPRRHSHSIDVPSSDADGILLLMPAWQPGAKLGVKTVSIYPGNRAAGLPGLHSTYILFDAKTGAPEAMLDGDTITSRRTVAASALAGRYLSRPDSNVLLLVGAGRVGSLIPDAYAAVRPIQRVLVWDIDSAAANRLVQVLQKSGFDSEVVADLEIAASVADIISCATLSTTPLILGKWLRPGVHLDLIGGFTPDMRESDDDCYIDTSVFIDTDEALAKAGDLLSPMKNSMFSADRVLATLEDLCRDVHPGRRSPVEITVFKAVGTALEDLAAACAATED